MTYEKIVEKIKKYYAKADASELIGHFAVEFDVRGEGEGAFYVEVTDGVIDVQPFEYYDKGAAVIVPSDVLAKIYDGKLSIEDAYNEKLLSVEGDLGTALALTRIKPAAKKTATKKAEPKKTEPKKTEAKKATAKKAEPKKATAKKAEPKKTKPVAKKA